MEFGFIIFAVIAWMVISALREAAQKLPRPPREPRTGLPESSGTIADASPTLRELLEAIEAAQRPRVPRQPPERPRVQPPRRPPVEPPRRPTAQPAEFTEDTTSLEDMREEVAPARAVREEVDLDLESIEVARRRREAVAERERPRTTVDHAAFDARIRAQPADATAVAPPAGRSATLREAMIWREILGPPRSLSDE